MGCCSLLWLFASALGAATYGEPSVEAREWIPDGVEPASVPQCGKTTELTLPPSWRIVDCRMGNMFLRHDRMRAEIRLHAMMPRFDLWSEEERQKLRDHLLPNLIVRERIRRTRVLDLDMQAGYPGIPVPDLGACTRLPPDDVANSSRYAFSRDGLDIRGKMAAKETLKDGRAQVDWLAVGRWPAGNDAAALRDFNVIFDSVNWR